MSLQSLRERFFFCVYRTADLEHDVIRQGATPHMAGGLSRGEVAVTLEV